MKCATCGYSHTRASLLSLLGCGLDTPLAGGTVSVKTLTPAQVDAVWTHVDRGMAPGDAVRAAVGARAPTIAPVIWPMVPEVPATPPTPGSIDALIDARIAAHHAPVDPAAIDALINERLASLTRPLEITVRAPGIDPVTIRGAHEQLTELLALVDAGEGNILLTGPAGAGKSSLVRSLAEALSVPPSRFVLEQITGSTTVSKLVGRLTDGGTYISSRIVDALRYDDGISVICLDEYDSGDENVLLCLNSLMGDSDNRWLSLPNGELLEVKCRVIVVATANTFGRGRDRIYTGRNQLDGASLDRFGGQTAILEVDYSPAVEESKGLPADKLSWVRETREKMARACVRQILGTRFVISAARQLKVGIVWDTIKSRAMAAWTPQERAAVGEAS